MGDRYPVPRHGVIPGAVIQLLAAETLLQGSSPVPHGPLLPLFLSLLSIPFLLRLPGKRRALGFMGASLALADLHLIAEMANRSAKRRVGKECVSTGRYRGWRDP